MKLSQLTTQDKIKLAAELDGWKHHPDGIGMYQGDLKFWTASRKAPDYLTSYDAIIPLVQKLDMEYRVESFLAHSLLLSTPSQLLDALLVATGTVRYECVILWKKPSSP